MRSVCWWWVTFAGYFEGGFIDHLGGSSENTLHAAEISHALAIKLYSYSWHKHAVQGNRTTMFEADENEWQAAKHREDKSRAGPKAEDTSQACRT